MIIAAINYDDLVSSVSDLMNLLYLIDTWPAMNLLISTNIRATSSKQWLQSRVFLFNLVAIEQLKTLGWNHLHWSLFVGDFTKALTWNISIYCWSNQQLMILRSIFLQASLICLQLLHQLRFDRSIFTSIWRDC